MEQLDGDRREHRGACFEPMVFEDGMRAVIDILDRLEACDDLDALYRQAVELTRERLELDRTAIFVAGDPGRLRGTFGTDLRGRTTDERQRLGLRGWHEKLGDAAFEPYELVWEPYSEFVDDEVRIAGEGWIAVTPIRSRRRARGVFCNDTARTGRPVDPVRQQVVVLFCALFGALLDRKEAELARRRSEHLLSLVLGHAPLILFATDLAGNLTVASGRALAGFGRETGNLLEIYQDHPEILTNLRRALAGETFTALVAARGRHFHTAYSPLREVTGAIGGMVGVAIDITEQVLGQRALEAAKTAAETASRTKDEFLARISHELRNPLQGILGMTRLALEGPLQDDHRHYLEVAAASADWLRALLDDILEFSTLDTLEPTLVERPFGLRACVAETVLAMVPAAASRGIELLYRIDAQVPDALLADAQRLRQILSNLLQNAIKFTSAGHVLSRVRASAIAERRVELELSVEDTGSGIPAAEQARVFEPFVQGAAAEQKRGVGLGLAIVQHLAQRMDGRVEVGDRPGGGSRFLVRLRLNRQPNAANDGLPPAPPALRGQAALLLNGSEICRQVLGEMLADWGLVTIPVTTAYRPGDERPVVVLLEARRAATDGWERIAEIRARWGELPVILLKPPQPVATEGGAAAVVIQPVRQTHLLAAIGRVTEAASPDPPAAKPAGPGPRILVVEDHEPNRELVAVLLGKRHYPHRLADSGEAALRALAAERFDLVLLDLQMPGLDGFEVTRRIRAAADPAIAGLPILALTAHAMRGDRERCLASGMDDYLAKPFRPEELFGRVDQLVAARHSFD